MTVCEQDNVVNQRLALKMLQKLGHVVEIVGNGREALEKVKCGSIDLVFMDCHMPEMDGLAATRAIREWERVRGAHVPIIAMTAMTMEGDQETCLSAGMDAFISKPVAMKVLRETIQLVMDTAAQQLQLNCGTDSIAPSTEEGHSVSAR
jgi:two-component system sensor histidine kinase/response regulator